MWVKSHLGISSNDMTYKMALAIRTIIEIPVNGVKGFLGIILG